MFTSLLKKWRKEGSKVLVFSISTQMLDIIDSCFKVEKYEFVRLDGSMNKEKRKQAVEEFSTNPRCFAFLLSTNAGCTGLNLVAADVVVNINQSWNPARELQSHDRAFRMGQKRDVSNQAFESFDRAAGNSLSFYLVWDD